jgi:hypothetical protein
MDRNSKEWYEVLLKNYYNQLHLTVIDEPNFLKILGSNTRLIKYRDSILDKINEVRRILRTF